MADAAEALSMDMIALGQRIAQSKAAPTICGPVMRATAPHATTQLLDALANLPPNSWWGADPECQAAIVAWTQETVAFSGRANG